MHSVYSDGTLTPEQLTIGARAAGLDFLATTEHNTTAAHGAWRRVGDDLHLAQVHRAGGMCVAAHALAEWGRGLAADILEGRWRPAMGNSDTHLDDQIGIPHTVVLAEELSVEAILTGVCAGRSWIAESAAVELSFTVSAGGRSAGIGERLNAGDEPAVARAHVRGVPAGAVTFHTEQGTVHRAPLPGPESGAMEWRTNAEQAVFVRVEVRHPDGRMVAMSNPIILI